MIAHPRASRERRKTPPVLAAVPAAVLLFCGPVSAANWTPIQPEGGRVDLIVPHPRQAGTVLIGIYRYWSLSSPTAIYESRDWGGHWSPARWHLGGADVQAVAIDPTAENTIVVAAARYGVDDTDEVFVSTDGGEDWERQPRGWGRGEDIGALIIAPTSPSMIYAATSNGLYRKPVTGGSWKRLEAGVAAPGYSALAVDPSDPSVLYAGEKDTLLRTEDGGNTWSVASANAPSYLERIRVDPRSSKLLYALNYKGLWLSEDRGRNWRRLPAGHYLHDFAIDPTTSPSTLYVAATVIKRSMDGGHSWDVVRSLAPDDANRIEASSVSGTRVYVGLNYRGLLESDDQGRTWRSRNDGVKALPLDSIVPHPSESGILYASRGPFVLVSSDSGGHWSFLPAPEDDFWVQAADETDSDLAYGSSWRGHIW